MKSTAIAPSNIAFIKYWGKKDSELNIPANGSISMNLSDLLSKTTVEFREDLTEDEVTINGKIDSKASTKVSFHLDRIRALANLQFFAKVESVNNFPASTGLSSSASGFAALTLAATSALDLNLSERELSIIARCGSGSACRSIPSGFVEWTPGESNETSFAYSLYPPEYFDVVDIVAILSDSAKDVATTLGQKSADSSPFYRPRLTHIANKINELKKSLEQKDFTTFGKITESEALELHAIMLTSSPSLIYLLPQTIAVMKFVKKMRNDGVECYFSLNTGQNIHVLCQSQNVSKVTELLKQLPEVKEVIENRPIAGAHVITEHLF